MSPTRFIPLVLLLCLLGRAVLAQSPGASLELHLRDGSVLRVTLVERNERALIVEHAILGRLEILHEDIVRIEGEGPDRSFWRRDPDQNTVMLCPTPQTIGQGKRYFRNFELFVLNFGVGVHERIDVSAGVLFPLSTDFNLMAIGAKVMLIDRGKRPFGLAVAGNLAKLEESEFGSGVLIAGIGDARRSLNASIHQSFEREGDASTFYMLGGDLQTGRSSKLVAEYTTGLSPLFDDEDELDGFLNVGFRWFGDESSFTLTGIRPLGVDTDSFIAFPLAMYSRVF